MTKLKVRGLKWKILKVRGSILHFYLIFNTILSVGRRERMRQKNQGKICQTVQF